VAIGHPDKLADQISDSMVDASLGRDPFARVACEALLAEGCIVLAGELRAADAVAFHAVHADAPRLVRDLLRPTCRPTPVFGHFGREDAGYPLERAGRTDALRRALGR
jgi:S-adenosylmethionine synthetase